MYSFISSPLQTAVAAVVSMGVAQALPLREENLFFASGDHGDGWRGFMEGAIASGSQTAIAILKTLGQG